MQQFKVQDQVLNYANADINVFLSIFCALWTCSAFQKHCWKHSQRKWNMKAFQGLTVCDTYTLENTERESFFWHSLHMNLHTEERFRVIYQPFIRLLHLFYFFERVPTVKDYISDSFPYTLFLLASLIAWRTFNISIAQHLYSAKREPLYESIKNLEKL